MEKKEVTGEACALTHISHESYSYRWSITNYASLRCNFMLKSPIFKATVLTPTDWYLALGHSYRASEGKVSVVLSLEKADDLDAEISVSYTFHLLDDDDRTFQETDRHTCIGRTVALIDRHELLLNKSLLLDGALVILCKMEVSSHLIQSVGPSVYQRSVSKDMQLSNLQQQAKLYWIMLEDELLTDVKLCVEGQFIKAHKFILAAQSEVFRTELKDGVSTFRIRNMDTASVKNMLLYMYSGILEDLSIEMIEKLYNASISFAIAHLRKTCVDVMANSLTTHSICRVLRIAKTHSEAKLMDAAENFICVNAKEVMKTKEWKSLEEKDPKFSWNIRCKAAKFL